MLNISQINCNILYLVCNIYYTRCDIGIRSGLGGKTKMQREIGLLGA